MVFKKETYSNQVAAFIRTLIMDGELPPGSPVKEALLADRLGISRAPIREALQELAHEGLVTSEPQKGKRVRLLSGKDIRDSYAVGGILEATGVAESLALWSEEDMQALMDITEAMRARSENAAGIAELVELDDLFHAALLRRCDNARLVELARLSCVTISKVLCYKKWLTLFSPQGFYSRHADLARAASARDAARLGDMLREHYREIGERMSRDMDG